jgi:4-hydroxy-2-oxoheptanedioate aldolase
MNAGGPVALLANRLHAGEKLFIAWCGIPEVTIPEALARDGYDAALLDMQHGAYDFLTAARGIAQVALAGKPTLVRIPVGQFANASRLLDYGAAGIVAPMVNSGDDARRFASFVKFPPMGDRSWGPRHALPLTGMDAATYLKEGNGIHLAIAMIETRQALGALDDILSVPGLDGVLVGPSDLSIALTNGATVDPHHAEVEKALEHVLARCREHKKIACLFCVDGKRAKEMSAKGFQLCSVSTDSLSLRIGAKAELAAARG